MATWNVSTPSGLDKINKVAQQLREAKEAIEAAFSEEHYFPEGYHKFLSDSLSPPNPDKIGRWRYNPGASYAALQRDTGTEWDNLTTPANLFPSGITMLFCQTSAPVGWTRKTTHDDRMLRVASGVGAGVGGAWGLTLPNTTTTHTHTLSAYIGTLTHSITYYGLGGDYYADNCKTSLNSHVVDHTHDSVSNSDYAHIHTIADTWKPAYKDVIEAERD